MRKTIKAATDANEWELPDCSSVDVYIYIFFLIFVFVLRYEMRFIEYIATRPSLNRPFGLGHFDRFRLASRQGKSI